MAAFCGVGNPESFFSHVSRNNLTLALTRTFPDHHHYNQREIDNVVEEARQHNAGALITTAKDAVKLRTLRFDLPCYVLDIEIVMDDAAAFLALMRSALRS
jgi:tetraacyldisaccharide 4'-kinase